MHYLLELFVSITASVTAHYICKWFDQNDNDDSKPDR